MSCWRHDMILSIFNKFFCLCITNIFIRWTGLYSVTFCDLIFSNTQNTLFLYALFVFIWQCFRGSRAQLRWDWKHEAWSPQPQGELQCRVVATPWHVTLFMSCTTQDTRRFDQTSPITAVSRHFTLGSDVWNSRHFSGETLFLTGRGPTWHKKRT